MIQVVRPALLSPRSGRKTSVSGAIWLLGPLTGVPFLGPRSERAARRASQERRGRRRD